MKINRLKINSYGNLKNKDIEFKDGINLVYGENEKGKSTLLNCIVNMLYGTSKNKKGRDISDYDKYKPWDTEEFSGKMNYTLENGDSFEIYREFGKKNPKIYNQDMEDVSKEYSIDKSSGSQFFFEQTGIDEQTFTSTVVSFQNEIELDGQQQNVLLQKIANSSTTGSENVSYKKAMDKLYKKQLDEIGTNRSQGKPINIVVNEINRLNEIEQSLKPYENYKYELEGKRYKNEEELESIKFKNDFLNKLNNLNQEYNVENQKLKYSERKIDDIEQKIQDLMQDRDEKKEGLKTLKKTDKEKANLLPYYIGIIVCIIIAILIFVIVSNLKAIAAVPLIIAVIIAGLMYNKSKKIKKKNRFNADKYAEIATHNKDLERKIYEMNAQIELLEKNKNELINEAEGIKNEGLINLKRKKESLKESYNGRISESTMSYYLNENDLSKEMNDNLNMMNEKNMEIHRLSLDKENILPKLDELVENEEKMSALKEEYESLVKKNDAMNMVREIIEEAHQKMKNEVTPGFTQNLSKNFAFVTSNKYNNVIINEDEGILIELPNGDYKNANLMSKGTIQQLYLAFRLSLIDDISKEPMPIVFDEIFAYADDKRLKDMIEKIEEFSKQHQVILFTCTSREDQIMNAMNINYNRVSL
ncbi:MAG: AAA family ATPase [Clostridia bacterium]|nr:AAA family ATPase [Clostridia bacterium]